MRHQKSLASSSPPGVAPASTGGFRAESLLLALQVGLACLVAQAVLTLLFAKVLPPGFWARKPGFLAHQVIALPIMIVVAVIGTRAWFAGGPATPEARVYDRAPDAETLCAILLGELVLWDIPLTMLPSIYSRASMGHHVGLAALAAICLSPYLQYYAPFFAGVIEISSVPLQVVDFFHPKHFADLLVAHPRLNGLNALARVAFIVSFVALRTVWFPIVMFANVFPDLFHLLPHAGASRAVWLVIAMIFGLSFTALQLYWSVLLFRQVRKALRGGKSKESGGSPNAEARLVPDPASDQETTEGTPYRDMTDVQRTAS